MPKKEYKSRSVRFEKGSSFDHWAENQDNFAASMRFLVGKVVEQYGEGDFMQALISSNRPFLQPNGTPQRHQANAVAEETHEQAEDPEEYHEELSFSNELTDKSDVLNKRKKKAKRKTDEEIKEVSRNTNNDDDNNDGGSGFSLESLSNFN